MIIQQKSVLISLLVVLGIAGAALNESGPKLQVTCDEFSHIGWSFTEGGGVRQNNFDIFFAYPDRTWYIRSETRNNTCSENDAYLIFEDQKITTVNRCEDTILQGTHIKTISPKNEEGEAFLFNKIYDQPGTYWIELSQKRKVQIDSTNLKCALFKAEQRNRPAL